MRRVLVICIMGLLWGCGEPPAPDAGPPPDAVESEPIAEGAPEPVVGCVDRDPLRGAYFGELHVHTRHSMDAYAWDVRATPDDAYRFARGEPIQLPPLDANGRGSRSLQLERPLDFAAVTDHAAYLGPVTMCATEGSFGYDAPGCQIYRRGTGQGSMFDEFAIRMGALFDIPEGADEFAMLGQTKFSKAICGEDGAACREERRSVWQEIQASAERWNDTSSACEFTAFKAYEYTLTPDMSKVHRNVIFRNAAVPELPISSMDEPHAEGLWRQLELQCLQAGTGCDALTIPHNSNFSNGRIFALSYRDRPEAEQLELATRRAALEPLAEISQIKGDSECRNGMYRVLGGTDDLCEYEKMRQMWGGAEDCEEGTGKGALTGQGCQSRIDFVRYALIEGLAEAERIGINPIKVGIIAATDTHNASPGDVEERSYDGWSGAQDATVQTRLGTGGTQEDAGRRFGLTSNPGGLAGVWAEENSRDSLFDAMQRRETFGTSGPRIAPRFFGGWEYAASLCDDPDFVAKGYQSGVPMGGDLPPRPEGAAAPVFAVSALRDAGTPEFSGGKLQRIQIVKGWVGEGRDFHQAIYDVAGSKEAGASVDMATCEPQGPGADSLCAVWRDPDFDPEQHAVYYVRALENPSCRWNAWQCLSLPEDERPPACSDSNVPMQVQERAWTSPIWYVPGA
ncbi:MAG: DUF3604 domain-containing protein [Deltaproteobacteria bacterium]|nr:DUF3604 domain-containing protein [Deltaproteobacteria bacterium]MBW2363426.1 DUF3604 domain-containing protein [Deltaproteobacteria bacterium]